MRIQVQIIIESDQEATPALVEEVACFERGPLTPETLGLQLDEAKQMLDGVQQVKDYVEYQRQCSHCQQSLVCKGHHLLFITVYGPLFITIVVTLLLVWYNLCMLERNRLAKVGSWLKVRTRILG